METSKLKALSSMFGSDLALISSATVTPKIKTFEDDPTLFGQVAMSTLTVNTAEVTAYGATEVRRRIEFAVDKMRREIAVQMPRCAVCEHCTPELRTSPLSNDDATNYVLRMYCKSPKQGGFTLTCPDGSIAVAKGHKALVNDRPEMTDDLLDAMREAWKYHPDTQPDITPASPDKPTTLANDAW